MSRKILDALTPLAQRYLQAVEFAQERHAAMKASAFWEMIGATPGQRSKVASGEIKNPQGRTIEGLRAAGVNPDWVRTGEGELWLPPGEASDPGRLSADRSNGAAGSEVPRCSASLDAAEMFLLACYRIADSEGQQLLLDTAREASRPSRAVDRSDSIPPVRRPLVAAREAPER